MSARRQRAFVLGFFGLLGVLAGLFFLSRTTAAAPPVRAAPPLTALPPQPGELAPPQVPANQEAAGRAALVQVPLLRPPAGERDAGLRRLAEQLPQPRGPVDKRENPGPNAGREMEIISYAFETLEEDVRDCLQQWEATAPGQAAQVMIAFELDADGLQRSWLEHDTEVPFGPRTCLANAVYGLDWSRIVDHPAKLTQRFELGRPDGG